MMGTRPSALPVAPSHLRIKMERDKSVKKPVVPEVEFLRRLRGQLAAAVRNHGNQQSMLALRMVDSRLEILGGENESNKGAN